MTAADQRADAPPPAIGHGAHDLAAALSIAVRIEPELVRAMRINLFPQLGVEVESDLWFHPELVRTRGSGGIVLDTPWRAALQARLRQWIESEHSNALAQDAWSIVSRVHRHVSPTIRLEEEINWLAVSGRGSQIEKLLGPALKAVADEGREGVARWFAAAWSRLPQAARETAAAWKLAQVSETLVPGTVKLRRNAPARVETAHLADIVGLLGDVKIGVRMDGDEIELGQLPPTPDTFAIAVPNTSPRVLTLLGGPSGPDQPLTVPVGAAIRARIDTPTARLRTARGFVFEVPATDGPRGVGRVKIEGREEETQPVETIQDQHAPVFYLSYAHSRTQRREGNSSDRRVEQLFGDLSDHLGDLIHRSTGADIGFIDRSIGLGERWRSEVTHALETCQVFVALTSVPYFQSEWCGREWAAFESRTITSPTGPSPRGTNILPVLWAPNLSSRVPTAVAEIQSFQPRNGPELSSYREHGLLGLQVMGQSEAYQSIVWQLANRVAELYYANTVLPRQLSIDNLPNAFRDGE